MNNPKIPIKVAVIAGGNSSEREVSLRSAKQVFESLDRELYTPYLIDLKEISMTCNGVEINKNDFSLPDVGRLDYALIVVHGTPGENGILQGYLDLVGVPYSSSSTLVSALTFDKELTKLTLGGVEGMEFADQVIVRRGEKYDTQEIASRLRLPLFVKPNASGSSFGVTKAKSVEQISSAIEEAFEQSETVMCEEFIEGTEISQGVMICSGKEYVLPITELVSHNEFFDYEAKYTAGMTDEITPARIADEVARRVSKATLAAYKKLGCRGVVRIDYIIRDGVPYFIEVNGVPGMSAASIVPQQWAAIGLTMQDGWRLVIEDTRG